MWVAVVCLSLPALALRLPKCCPLGEDAVHGPCMPTDRPMGAVPVQDSRLRPLPPVQQEYEWRPLTCPTKLLHSDQFFVLYNGSLHRGEGYRPIEEYCLENLDRGKGLQIYPITCAPLDTEYQDWSYIINSVGHMISIPFSLATIIVFICIKELRAVWGVVTCNAVISSMASYIGSCTVSILTGLRIVHTSHQYCHITGYAIQFFFMATFFWLNVMCFDIYWAFSGLKSLTGSVKERDRKKLILYSIYAWGAPLLILLITLGIDYSPAIPDSSPFKPKVGVEKCFFISDFATGIYFYSPMGIVILINIVLFSVTAVRIFTLRRETKVLNREDSRKHTSSTNDKESVCDQHTLVENMTSTQSSSEENRKEPYLVKNIRFTLYLKLFIVMGINWVMELISFLAGGPIYLWYIPDFTNTLQGVFIFIIFVWKKRVKRLIWAKLRSCVGKGDISNGSKSPWTASTRNTSTSGTSQNNTNSIKMQPIPEPNLSTPQINTTDTV